MMKERIEELLAQIDGLKCKNAKEVEEARVKLLGKKGEITGLFDEFRTFSPDLKKEFGRKINELKQAALAKIDQLREQTAVEAASEGPREDLSMPGTPFSLGSRHPVSIVRQEIVDIFRKFGYDVAEGPEIEDDDHNFTRLNVAKDHPARDMQDTFYIDEDILLRTHTSPGQIRVMDMEKPPIKVLVPGRVFRSDSDATHSPMFHQMEGLVVDKGITLCDLQGMLDKFVQQIFDADVKTRLRPSYFPFTEPSVEVDVSCFECGGKGCGLCKHTGWIEVLGGGVVHQNVLRNCGIDPEVYSGFAFGIGLERMAMRRFQISDLRLIFENDVRFLEQF